MKTVAISAGHQPGVDNGASKDGLYEADLTIKIADRVVEILRKHSVPTLYVPNNISLTSTISWINDRANQIDGCAVDIHINSGGGTGWEAYYYGNGNNESSKLSQFMVDAMVEEAGLKSRGIKSEYNTRHGKLGFVHDTIPVAALVECGFIDTEPDRFLLSSDEGIYRIAKGVARGILEYIKVAWNPSLLNPAPVTPEKNDTCINEKIKIKELEDQLKIQINQNMILRTEYENYKKQNSNQPTIVLSTAPVLSEPSNQAKEETSNALKGFIQVVKKLFNL